MSSTVKEVRHQAARKDGRLGHVAILMLVVNKLRDGACPHWTCRNLDLKDILMEEFKALGHQPATLKTRGSGQVAQYNITTKTGLYPVQCGPSMGWVQVLGSSPKRASSGMLSRITPTTNIGRSASERERRSAKRSSSLPGKTSSKGDR
jgi:hypothetical protein